jgi:hypothetical protein
VVEAGEVKRPGRKVIVLVAAVAILSVAGTAAATALVAPHIEAPNVTPKADLQGPDPAPPAPEQHKSRCNWHWWG